MTDQNQLKQRPECNIKFRTDNWRFVYYSHKCTRRTRNRAYYQSHPDTKDKMRKHMRDKRRQD